MYRQTNLFTKRNAYFLLIGLLSFLAAYVFDRYYIFGEKNHILTKPLEIIFNPQ